MDQNLGQESPVPYYMDLMLHRTEFPSSMGHGSHALWDRDLLLHGAGIRRFTGSQCLSPHGNAEFLPHSPGHRSPLNDFQRLRATELLAAPVDPPPPLPEQGTAEQCAQRCATSLACR